MCAHVYVSLPILYTAFIRTHEQVERTYRFSSMIDESAKQDSLTKASNSGFSAFGFSTKSESTSSESSSNSQVESKQETIGSTQITCGSQQVEVTHTHDTCDEP